MEQSLRGWKRVLAGALTLLALASTTAAQIPVDPPRDADEEAPADVKTNPQSPAADSDSAIDEAPVDMPLPTGEGASAAEEEDAVEAAFSLPAPEILAKLPMFVTAFAKTTLTLQNPYDRKKLDKWVSDTFLGILMAGQITKNFGVTAAIFGLAIPKVPTGTEFTTGQFLDFLAVVRFEPSDYFNIWIGHVPVPSDRSALSSPFFMAPWKYPGEVTPGAFPLSPKTATFAGISANNGPTVWGQLGKGKFKYYLGAYLQDPEGDAIFNGRVTLNLLSPEPGYLHASGYYGAKGDIFAIGGSVQMQRNGSLGITETNGKIRADYVGGNVDILFEKKFGAAGVLDLEAAYYRYDGKYERFDYSGFLVATYLFPFRLGYGKPQLVFRAQAMHQKQSMNVQAELYTVYDAQISYIVKGDYIKAALGYTRWQNESAPGHAIFLGLQAQK